MRTTKQLASKIAQKRKRIMLGRNNIHTLTHKLLRRCGCCNGDKTSYYSGGRDKKSIVYDDIVFLTLNSKLL